MSVRTLKLAVLFAALALAFPVRAQPKAHKDDIDVPLPKKDQAPEEAPADDAIDENHPPDTFIPGRPDLNKHRERGPDKRARAGARDAGAPASDAGPVGDAGVGGAAGVAGDKQLKAIVPPPPDGDLQLAAAWAERKKALVRGASKETVEAEKRLLQLRDDMGYVNLFSAASALCRESALLSKTDGPEAVRRALLAAQLAPDLPAAHWAVARAALHEDLTNVGRYVGSSVDALRTTWAEPRFRAAFVCELAAALLAALLLAGAACICLVFVRYVRYFLHDFHHLFPPGAWQVQTALTGLLVVAMPPLFGLGPAAFLFGLALATWLQMERRERIVVGLIFALGGLLPLAASAVDRFATFSGTRAESVWLVQAGGPDAEPLAQIQALAERPDPPFEALFTLGRRARHHGDILSSIALLRQAAEQRPGSSAALLELGNALFLSGDLDGAKDTYQRVLSLNEGSAEAHYNLARLFDRRAQMAAREEAAPQLADAQTHIHRTIDLDPRLASSLAGEPDMRANRFLAGAGLSDRELADMAGEEAHPSWVADGLSARLFGPLPRAWAPFAGLLAAALLALMSLLKGPVVPSGACSKCGRPVCRRCDSEVVGPGLCGQCVTVFAHRGAIDPPQRAAKEMSIRRWLRRRTWTIRLSGIALGGAGQVLWGQAPRGLAILFPVALGAFLLAFPEGLLPAPWGASPVGLRVVPAVLLILVPWVLGVRRAFRQTAALNLIKIGVQAPPAEEPAASKPEPGPQQA